MKRAVSLLTALVITISLCSVATYAFAENSYSADFDLILTMLQIINNSANMAAETNLNVWKEAGPSYVLKCLDQLDKYGDKDLGNPYPSKGIIPILVRVYGSDVRSGADVYHLSLTPLRNIENVKEVIKTFRSNYPDHATAAKALQDYYIKLSAYADIILNPDGSYLTYMSDIKSYQKELLELKGNAEFEK